MKPSKTNSHQVLKSKIKSLRNHPEAIIKKAFTGIEIVTEQILSIMNPYMRCVYPKYPHNSKFCTGHLIYTGNFLTFHSGLSERRKARRREKKACVKDKNKTGVLARTVKSLPGSLSLLKFKSYIAFIHFRCVYLKIYFRNYFFVGQSFYTGAFQQFLPGIFFVSKISPIKHKKKTR